MKILLIYFPFSICIPPFISFNTRPIAARERSLFVWHHMCVCVINKIAYGVATTLEFVF